MKNLLSLILLATVLFMAAPAKAEVQYEPSQVSKGFFESLLDLVSSNVKTASSGKIETNYTLQSAAAVSNAANCVNTSNSSKTKAESIKPGSTTTENSVHLPINNGIVFLLVAGLAIGITTVSKSKQFKLAAVRAS